jgi:CDP-diacylglycerol--glycerol-3-phosphate 3-phosphatidyltransferase
MLALWRAIVAGYLRLIEPIIEWCVRWKVPPNLITVLGTAWCGVAGALFATGHIRLAGWTLGLTAFFDVVDGAVARRAGTATTFGSFLDSTLDRVADAFLFGGLTLYYASGWFERSLPMLTVSLVALVATFLTSYVRARAELLGIGMKGIGWFERPERITLLAAPPAFFGLAFDGKVLAGVVILLAALALITVVQRVTHVARESGYLRAQDAEAPNADGTPAVRGNPR